MCTLLALGACADAPETEQPSAADVARASSYAHWPDPLDMLPSGPAQTAAVCARAKNHAIRDLFCAQTAPRFTSIYEVHAALGMSSAHLKEFTQIASGDYATISVTGHSSALSTRSVSAINPRVIAMQIKLVPLSLSSVAFTRGEQFLEMVASDRTDKSLHFYLLKFRQACNAQPKGCTPGELLTPAVEAGWTETTLYDEKDLENTTLDCKPCHEPTGPGTLKFLRMQEFDAPWTHWFSSVSEGGKALLDDYFAAHGDEALSGFTPLQIMRTDPQTISTFVTLSNSTQPNVFHSAVIEDEVKASAARLGGNQPFDNSIPGSSATWRESYELARGGGAISVPYHNVKVTDPAKLARATAAYQAYRRGELPLTELPDIRDVFSDDPKIQAELGIGTEPGADGRAVLMQACNQCHSPLLDQSISRAKFRADLQGMDRKEKDLAIERLLLPPHDPKAMPPARLRVLTPEARQRAIDVLRQ